MSYKWTSGSVRRGDIYAEEDTTGDATYIDWGQDTITFRPGDDAILFLEETKVGIGTTTPDTLLHLYGTSPAISLQRDNNSTGTSTINFEGAAGVVACKMGQVAGTDNELAFSTHDGANLLERMRIDEDGFIGIGTTAPEAYLDIKNTTDDGATNRTMIQMYNYRADDADENDWAPTSIDFKVENVAGGVKGATARIATVLAPIGTDHNSVEGERSSALIFSTMDDTTLSEAARINHLGYVGIGTDDPDYALDVAGDIGINEYIYHNGDTDTFIRLEADKINIEVGGENMIYMVEGSGGDQADKLTINNDSADVDFQVKGASEVNLLRTDAANDRVGILTLTPGSTFHTAGSVGFNVTVFTSSDTLDETHHVAVADCNAASVTLTLPSATAAITGRQYIIKRADSGGSGGGNSLTIGRNSANIDGAGSDISSIENGTSHTLICIGTSGWILVDKYVGI